jgi:hypothetical protein
MKSQTVFCGVCGGTGVTETKTDWYTDTRPCEHCDGGKVETDALCTYRTQSYLNDSKLRVACEKCNRAILCIRPEMPAEGGIAGDEATYRCKCGGLVTVIWSVGQKVQSEHYRRRGKLSDEQVVEIRKLREEGMSYKAIGALYDVTHVAVMKVCGYRALAKR